MPETASGDTLYNNSQPRNAAHHLQQAHDHAAHSTVLLCRDSAADTDISSTWLLLLLLAPISAAPGTNISSTWLLLLWLLLTLISAEPCSTHKPCFVRLHVQLLWPGCAAKNLQQAHNHAGNRGHRNTPQLLYNPRLSCTSQPRQLPQTLQI
jgi:hypothetical protein